MPKLVAVVLLAVLVTGPVAASTPGMIYSGPTDAPRIALTFDADMTSSMREQVLDGTHSHFDRRILRLLRETNTPATIFLTGLWAKTYPAAARRMAANPLFELANHSHTHRAFRAPCYGLPTLTTKRERRREIRRASAAIARITSVQPTYFRFPGGCHALADVRLVRHLGLVPVQWSVVSGDAYQKNPQVIVDRVLNKARNGSIVVMHLNGVPNAPATFDALREIIPALKASGYELVTLGDLLDN